MRLPLNNDVPYLFPKRLSLVVRNYFQLMTERKTCPIKKIQSGQNIVSKPPYQHFVADATMEDVKNDKVFNEMIEAFGLVFVRDVEYCEYLKHIEKNVCRTVKMVTPWWLV